MNSMTFQHFYDYLHKKKPSSVIYNIENMNIPDFMMPFSEMCLLFNRIFADPVFNSIILINNSNNYIRIKNIQRIKIDTNRSTLGDIVSLSCQTQTGMFNHTLIIR